MLNTKSQKGRPSPLLAPVLHTAMRPKPEFLYPKKKEKEKEKKRKKNKRLKRSFFVTQLIKLSTFEKVLLQCPGPRSKSVPATSAINAGVLLIWIGTFTLLLRLIHICILSFHQILFVCIQFFSFSFFISINESIISLCSFLFCFSKKEIRVRDPSRKMAPDDETWWWRDLWILPPRNAFSSFSADFTWFIF